MIDIIIPCYNSHKTIDRCLASIVTQNKECTVTLVNDGGENYSDIIKRYPLNIREIGYNENKGVGYARNYGLEQTSNELVMFMDSDDALSNVFTLSMLEKEMGDSTILISNFLEEIRPNEVTIRSKDTGFLHGKIYRREYLDKHNILFNNTKCNEDVGFNILSLLLTQNEKVSFSDFISYYWLYNENSIVRKDNYAYLHRDSIIGFAENMLWVFKELEKRNVDNTRILMEKVSVMYRLFHLLKRTDNTPYRNICLEPIRRYFKSIYRPIEQSITEEVLQAVNEALPTDKKEFKQFIGSLRR